METRPKKEPTLPLPETMGWTNSDDGKLVPKLMTLAASLYPKTVPRWLPVAANQDVQQIGAAAGMWDCRVQEHENAEALKISVAQMMLMDMSLQTNDSKWYSAEKKKRLASLSNFSFLFCNCLSTNNVFFLFRPVRRACLMFTISI